MEIYLDRRAIRQIRLAAQESIEEEDSESLREEVLEAFSGEQIEEIERRIGQIDRGEVQLVPWEEMMRTLRERLYFETKD